MPKRQLRDSVVLKKGVVRYYYSIVSSNGQIKTTSQKYFSETNARRAAKAEAVRKKCKFVDATPR